MRRQSILALLGLAGCTHAAPPAAPEHGPTPGDAPAGGSGLAVGSGHTCALDRTGGVWCWGARAHGQLGDRRVGYRPTPAPGPAFVPASSSQGWALGAFGPAIGLAATHGSTCALDRAGQIACWGRMSDGAAPLPIDGLDEFDEFDGELARAVELAMSDGHGCARTEDGRVWCWDEERTPKPVDGLEDAIELVNGSCARTAGGALRCWTFPDPTVDPRELRRQAQAQAQRDSEAGIQRVPPVRMARRLAPDEHTERLSARALRGLLAGARASAGDEHDLWLVDADGRLRELSLVDGGATEVVGVERRARVVREHRSGVCWIDDRGGVGCHGPPARDLPLADVVDLAVGRNHACAVTAAGAVACWGENVSGQLGDGTLEARPEPVLALGVDDAIAVAVGPGHTCAARRSGAIACWGIGEDGELGDPSVATSTQRIPVRVDGIEPALEVIASGTSTCARTSDGRVTCWGEGRGELPPRCIPTLGGGVECQPLFGMGSLCGGRALGHARTKLYPRTLANLAETRDLAASMGEFCAATMDGVTCWEGQTTCGSTGRDLAAITRRFALADAVGVAVGHAHLCAVDRRGEVYCAGEDTYGQLGGAPADAAALRRVPGVSGALALSAGYAHTCALQRGGEVTCWGFNATGQAGAPSSRAATPTQVPSISAAVELSSGFFHTCARRRTGEVLCWGENEYGALGDGAQLDRATPTRVLGIERAAAITSSGWRTCARADDGRVSCWGGAPHEAVAITQPRPVAVVPLAGSTGPTPTHERPSASP